MPGCPMTACAPPPRPSLAVERRSNRLFLALAPRLPKIDQPGPPPALEPWEEMIVPREGRRGVLGATWYPAARQTEVRGAVLLAHPWLEWGQAYFHRRGRIQALRCAGYHAMSFDLPGFGKSSRQEGYLDRDVGDAFAALAERAPGLPLHVWGVSSGGYWAHPFLAASDAATGAFFEDVSAHLFEWSRREMPLALPFFLFFRAVFPGAHRFFDLRLHAPHLGVGAATYVSGELDTGVVPAETRELARLAGGEAMIVPDAPHLGSIKVARRQVIERALATFARAEDRATSADA